MYRVLIVGAGEGGSKLIGSLSNHQEVRVVGVVDKKPSAPGLALAMDAGIPTFLSYTEALRQIDGVDVIFEATGEEAVFEHVKSLAHASTVVISGTVARIFMLLTEDKVNLIRQLEARKTELQLLLDATEEGMISVNRDGTIILFNRAASRMTGISVVDALGLNLAAVLPDTICPVTAQTGESTMNHHVEINHMELLVNTVPIVGDDGDILGTLEVLRDVTQLRDLAEEVTNLKEIQSLLEAIIQSTQDAISVVDKNGLGLLMNPAYTRLTGYRSEDVIGKPAEVDIAEGDSMHMRVLQTGKPVKNVPMKVGPARREVLVDVAPLYVNNELRGSVGVIHDVSEIKRLTEELDRAQTLLRSVEAKYTFSDIIGNSPAMILAVEQAKRTADTPATVLLRGESGTGKELFAHAIHNESSRVHHSFVRVNCAALSESLLESELFGYEEGAFTGAKRGGKKGLFEQASGGTLFLDEVGEMTLPTQAKLLRVLQEHEIVRVGGASPVKVDVRVIAATHINLEQAVATGKFREDLYYRLNVVPILIPPLRYRKGDIADLAMHIVHRHNVLYGRNVGKISEAALNLLTSYSWPGNVRELENAIGRAMIHLEYHNRVLDVQHFHTLRVSSSLPEDVEQEQAGTLPWAQRNVPLAEVVRQAEKWAIEEKLRETHGNKSEAARQLGISVRSLYYKLEDYQLSHGRPSSEPVSVRP